MIFKGHDHIYLRTLPINLTHSEDPQSFNNGTVHIITGGWGAPLYEPRTHWSDAYVERPSVYHFCLINIFNNNSLNLQAINSQNNVFDELWIRKCVNSN
jgi:hypothetical protein